MFHFIQLLESEIPIPGNSLWTFPALSDLQLGDQKVTLNHRVLVESIY